MENIENKIIEYFEGELNLTEQISLEKEIDENELYKKQFEEYSSLYKSFQKIPHSKAPEESLAIFNEFLDKEITKKKQSSKFKTRIFISLLAVLLIFSSIVIYKNHSTNKSLNHQMMAMNTKLQLLMQNDVSSQRIKAIQISANQPTTNNTAVQLLLNALSSDPSSNVRLSALEALEKHLSNDHVRAKVYKSMAEETDQVVLLTYINILSASTDLSAIDELQKITKDQGLDQFIKDEAHLGLFQLQEY